MTWNVAVRKVSIPSLAASASSFTWESGVTRTPSVSGYDSALMEQTGTASARNAGSYQITYTLKSTANCRWTDGTTTPKTVSWSIAPKKLSVPTTTSKFTWDLGKTFTPSVSGYNAALMVQEGETSAANAGDHTITYRLKDAANCRWTDGTTEAKTLKWKIDWKRVPVPTAVCSSTWKPDGKVHTPTISGYDPTLMIQEGETSSKYAGEHYLTYSLKDTTNCLWGDGSGREPIETVWTVEPEKYYGSNLPVDVEFDFNPLALEIREYDPRPESNYRTFNGWASFDASVFSSYDFIIRFDNDTANDITISGATDMTFGEYQNCSLKYSAYVDGYSGKCEVTFQMWPSCPSYKSLVENHDHITILLRERNSGSEIVISYAPLYWSSKNNVIVL